ncbi:hypothetical protein G7Y31_06740 [Corynebacterium lizhenjunii]|uniref:Uncharacterized protein n=1 Tax=Corynebacterium lizhenjunii TaxID=2709394 RepID=A0A7T0KDC3_9CORY|nr:hypothetical protein [Corynebacterium lizhenjunii]QPK78281.1 hypothetical protein G7Y31_06740 [Corynebacterium lizhenjunii]
MPTCDDHTLRHTARNLAAAYTTLNTLKHTPATQPEIRTMKPTPGPQTPGNWLYVCTYLEQETRLREVTFEALATIGVKLADDDVAAPRLCQLIAFHSQAISELNWASDLLEELRGQSRIIALRCAPREKVPARYLARAQASKQLFTAAHAAKIVTAITGTPVDRKQITYWGRAGYITTHTDSHGKACYNLNEIITHSQTSE